MTTIVNNESDQSTVLVNFDRQWKFTTVNKSSISEEFFSWGHDDQHWTSVDLPHVLNSDDSSFFWYRKQFNWKPKLDPQQHIYVNFNENQDEHCFHQQIPSIVIWFNEKQIYTGMLPNSLELTKYLRINANNLLVICSKEGHSLSLHAQILMPRVCVGQVNYDDIDQCTLKKRRQKLDYSASFNDSDGLIDVFIDSFRKMNKDVLREISEIDTDEDIEHVHGVRQSRIQSNLIDAPIPRLAILIMIVGTRGDVQPFIALAKGLLACGHRVRLATHETFRKFVRENGIEFYPLAGNPADLMSFMVKNAGIVPSVSSIVAGDIAKSRRVMSEILASTWKACIEDDDETGVPFVAEAIIANPPSYGHIHCAHKLQIPLHMMFTMPWSPTVQFPHPFCKVNYDLGSTEKLNVLSYDVVEMLTWSGMHDLINQFRKEVLGLSTLHTRQAVRLMIDERVPFTYCWSPSLVPKPKDWSSYIDVSGFFFLDLAGNYQPPEDLVNFLKAGDPPIYIGFGSITGHDPDRILKTILKALDVTGYRALLLGLASESDILPSNVFRIDNVPHDWLFQHVAAVCHHGGAGTTAAGLRAGKPTIIVPFFGDQFFWGSMIFKSGAGPAPIPGKRLNYEDLVEAFKVAHEPATRAAAEKLRIAFQGENGCEAAVRAFHAQLPLMRMRSDLEPSFAACFRLNDYNLQISRPVAQALVAADVIKESQLTIHPTRDWHASMYDVRPHLPIRGMIKHGRKAFTSLFIDTAYGLKRAASSNSLTTSTLDGAESIVRGVGKSIGHVYIGCLSFYGEITDALEQLPKLYDPYADSDERQRPRVDNLSSGAKAAQRSIRYGFEDAMTGIINKPRTGFERHGILGGAAGAAAAIPSIVVKPVVGTLASITWLGRGIYAEAKHFSHRNDVSRDGHLSVLTPSGGQRRPSSSSTASSDDQSPEARAAFESGFHIDICKQILKQFEHIQSEHDENSSSSTNDTNPIKEKSKTRKKLKKLFQRQRSHSATPH